MANWRGLLSRQVAHGRVVLRQILVAPIVFTPYHERGRRGYRFAGEALLTGLFEGLVEVTRLASPRGFGRFYRIQGNARKAA